MFKNKLALIVLILIIALGFFLRFYRLGEIPPGPEWDEASVGYNAYSIAQTGKDEWDTKWPLIFPAFGDYKNPLYIYLTAAVVKLSGLNIVTTRFINTLTGTLLILVWYFIADLIFRNRKISLLTSFFLAISPFGIFYSRIAGDGIMLSVFLIGTAILSELYFLKTKLLRFFIAAIFFLALSIFSYNLARIVSPPLMIIIFIINFLSVKGKKILFIIPLFLCLISFFILFRQSGISLSSRLQYVGIFGKEKGVVLQINEFRDHDKNNLVSKIVHNKATFFALTLASNYISYFSSDYLVNFKEQSNVSESHYPPLHLILLPFYYLGLFLLVAKTLTSKSKTERFSYLLLLILILVAPLPAIITEGQSGKRDLASLGTRELLSVYGLIYFINSIRQSRNRIVAVTICFVILLINIFSYLNFFYNIYPRNYGYLYAVRENKICNIIKNDYDRFDYFVFSRKIDGVPYIFPLFCLNFSPQHYWQTRQFVQKEGWFQVNSFYKFIFPDELTPGKLKNLSGKNVLLFATPEERNNILPIITPPLMQSLPVINDTRNMLYMFPVKL